jgi:hypothetical protein
MPPKNNVVALEVTNTQPSGLRPARSASAGNIIAPASMNSRMLLT